jgi:hypothetical protein
MTVPVFRLQLAPFCANRKATTNSKSRTPVRCCYLITYEIVTNFAVKVNGSTQIFKKILPNSLSEGAWWRVTTRTRMAVSSPSILHRCDFNHYHIVRVYGCAKEAGVHAVVLAGDDVLHAAGATVMKTQRLPGRGVPPPVPRGSPAVQAGPD